MASANIEIKAHARDLGATRAVAERLATEYLGVDTQVDTYFRTRSGRLKLRESSLSGAQLVPYVRPNEGGPKRSDYALIPVPDPEATKALLTETLGVHRVVEKEREIFLKENVRIHLDRVRGLGEFIELEAVFDGAVSAERDEYSRVHELMDALGVRDEDLIERSYEELVP